jgi:prevent-host-death family protein
VSAFGLFDAKNRFSELVARAGTGEDIVVTKHGRPVARIIAYADVADEAEAARRQSRSIARVRAVRARLLRRFSVEEIVEGGGAGRRP